MPTYHAYVERVTTGLEENSTGQTDGMGRELGGKGRSERYRREGDWFYFIDSVLSDGRWYCMCTRLCVTCRLLGSSMYVPGIV